MNRAAGGFVEALLLSALSYWKNPWFPGTSIALGNLSEWFTKFAAWMGIRLGIVERPLRRLVLRRNHVQFTQLPSWLKVGGLVIAGAVALCAMGSLSKLAEGQKS